MKYQITILTKLGPVVEQFDTDADPELPWEQWCELSGIKQFADQLCPSGWQSIDVWEENPPPPKAAKFEQLEPVDLIEDIE